MSNYKRTLGIAVTLLALVASCGGDGNDGVAVPGREGAWKTAAVDRAHRRLFDGAPPVIPHERIGAACTSCHNERGLEVPGVGFAPPSPHENTSGMSALSRCEQCHVFRKTDALFRESSFVALAQDLRAGKRLYNHAPPVIPHLIQMRENCQACHAGPAAREEVRCSHPERDRCQQCHVPVTAPSEFVRG